MQGVSLPTMRTIAAHLNGSRSQIRGQWMPHAPMLGALRKVTGLDADELDRALKTMVAFGYLEFSSAGQFRLVEHRVGRLFSPRKQRYGRTPATKQPKQPKQPKRVKKPVKKTMLEVLDGLVPGYSEKGVSVEAVYGPLRLYGQENASDDRDFPTTIRQFRGIVKRLDWLEFTDDTKKFVRRTLS